MRKDTGLYFLEPQMRYFSPPYPEQLGAGRLRRPIRRLIALTLVGLLSFGAGGCGKSNETAPHSARTPDKPANSAHVETHDPMQIS